MLNKRVEKALNAQINAELYSSYLYLSMASYFDDSNLPGFANWMKCQAQEEVFHAMKFHHYVAERGGKVVLEAIKQPPVEFESPLDVFEKAYAHEQLVSSLINDLVDIALEEKDHMTNNMLQWFVSEQVEEEASADEVVQKLKLSGEHGHAMLMLDKEMGARVFTYPATLGDEPA